MTLKVRGTSDKNIDALMKALANYEAKHPQAQIEAFRQGSYSIRIRVVDPDFKKIGKADRHDLIWDILDQLPEEVLSEISTILLLTPEEQKKSFANMEFDDPVPTTL
jgi:stress-induced morphogen